MKKYLFILILFQFEVTNGQVFNNLDSVTISSSRVSNNIIEAPKSVTVISSDEILSSASNSLDELLRNIVGLNINSRGMFGVQADIGIRGSTFSQVLLVIDDIRQNDPLTAHFNSNIPIALSEIERIEVIRGPSTLSYGSDAVGGVIHIKTKSYCNTTFNKDTNIKADLARGEHNTSISDISLESSKQNWSVSASIRNISSDGEQHLNPNFLLGTSDDSLYNNYFDLRTMGLAASVKLYDNVRWINRIGYDERDFAAKYFYTQSSFDESVEKVNNTFWQSNILIDKDNSLSNASFSIRRAEDEFIFNPIFAPNMHTTDFLTAQFNHTILFERNQISLGAQYLRKNIESTDRGDHNNNNFGLYAMGKKYISDRIFTQGGLRYEYDEGFGSELIPQLSITYLSNNIQISALYGKSIRAADFTERYISYEIAQLSPGRNVGNPNLEAERAHSFELNMKYQVIPTLRINSSVFLRKSSNLIDYILTNSNDIEGLDNLQPDSEYYFTQNISKSTTKGLELIFSYNPVWNRCNFQTDISYTYLSSKAEEGEISKYLANHPNHQLNLNLNFSWNKWSLSYNGQYINRNEEIIEGINAEVKSDYLLNHIKLSKSFHDGNLRPYFKVNNLTNTEYQEILGARMPKRWIMVGLSLNFD